MIPPLTPWPWVNVIALAFLLGIGWQLALLVWGAVLGLFRRLAQGGGEQ